MISSLVPALISAFKARRELALENVALRQQLAVLHRSVKRPRLSKVDREFWVLLRRIWTDWESVLVIVKPEMVIRWHRYRVAVQDGDHQETARAVARRPARSRQVHVRGS